MKQSPNPTILTIRVLNNNAKTVKDVPDQYTIYANLTLLYHTDKSVQTRLEGWQIGH